MLSHGRRCGARLLSSTGDSARIAQSLDAFAAASSTDDGFGAADTRAQLARVANDAAMRENERAQAQQTQKLFERQRQYATQFPRRQTAFGVRDEHYDEWIQADHEVDKTGVLVETPMDGVAVASGEASAASQDQQEKPRVPQWALSVDDVLPMVNRAVAERGREMGVDLTDPSAAVNATDPKTAPRFNRSGYPVSDEDSFRAMVLSNEQKQRTLFDAIAHPENVIDPAQEQQRRAHDRVQYGDAATVFDRVHLGDVLHSPAARAVDLDAFFAEEEPTLANMHRLIALTARALPVMMKRRRERLHELRAVAAAYRRSHYVEDGNTELDSFVASLLHRFAGDDDDDVDQEELAMAQEHLEAEEDYDPNYSNPAFWNTIEGGEGRVDEIMRQRRLLQDAMEFGTTEEELRMHTRSIEDVLMVFHAMSSRYELQPTLNTYSLVLAACAVQREADLATEIMRDMGHCGLTPTPEHYQLLVLACENEPERAHNYARTLVASRADAAKDPHVWHAVLQAFTQRAKRHPVQSTERLVLCDKIRKIFREMKEAGADVSAESYHYAMQSRALERNPAGVQSLMDEMRTTKQGGVMVPDRQCFETLIAACAVADRWDTPMDKAWLAFDQMTATGHVPSGLACGHLLSVTLRIGGWRFFLEAMDVMRESGYAARCFDADTYAEVLRAMRDELRRSPPVVDPFGEWRERLLETIEERHERAAGGTAQSALLSKMKQAAEEQKAAQDAIEMTPRQAQQYRHARALLTRKDRLHMAEQWLQEAVDRNLVSEKAPVFLLKSYQAADDIEGVIDAWQRLPLLLNREHSLQEHFVMASTLCEMHQFADARAVLAEAMTKHGNVRNRARFARVYRPQYDAMMRQAALAFDRDTFEWLWEQRQFAFGRVREFSVEDDAVRRRNDVKREKRDRRPAALLDVTALPEPLQMQYSALIGTPAENWNARQQQQRARVRLAKHSAWQLKSESNPYLRVHHDVMQSWKQSRDRNRMEAAPVSFKKDGVETNTLRMRKQAKYNERTRQPFWGSREKQYRRLRGNQYQ
ncbi:MAG: hypothetical protein MHM6MM_004084 [Cercozoa sp. M6MM]